MLVKEFFKNVGNLFVENEKFNDFLPTAEDYEILNTFFIDKYATVKIDYDEDLQTLEDMQKITYLTIVKRLAYYKAINESIQTTYNPVLQSIDIETKTTKTGTDETTKTGNDTFAKTGTDGTTGNTTSTDSGTITNTNNTFDNAAYRESDQTTQSGNGSTNTNTTVTYNTTDTNTYNTTDTLTHNTVDTTKQTGHNALDYAKVLKDIYDAKVINLYDVIINDVADAICEMVYYF